jgi:PAS domain S-box-containing protein
MTLTPAQLDESRRQFQSLVRSVKDYAIFMLDPDGRVATWNEGARAIKGYEDGEIIGRHFSTFYTEEDRALGKPLRLLELASRDGRIEDEGWRVRKDGSRFWADAIITAVRDEQGALLGFTKVTRDMTERRLAQEQLATRARRQARIAELGLFALQTRDLLMLMERTTRLITAELETQLSLVLELLPGGEALVVRASFGEEPGIMDETTFPAGTGSLAGFILMARQPVAVDDLRVEDRFAIPPILQSRQLVSGMGVVIDSPAEARPFGVFIAFTNRQRRFTEEELHFLQSIANLLATAIARMRTEEQLREAEKAAEEERQRSARAREALRERDEFISVAAHELRTPLTGLQLRLEGIARLVRKEVQDSSRASKIGDHLHEALRQTHRMADLVERLLDISRIVSGRLELDREELDLGTLAGDVIASFRSQALHTNTELRLALSGDLRGTWDRRRIEQVLGSLISNAFKYGGRRPIEVTLTGEPSTVHIVVRDQGIGIQAPDLERIFQRFERAVPLSHYGGLGVGLYLARHIVEAHGGRIRVSSQVGEGSSFIIDLPKHALSSGASLPVLQPGSG